MTKRLYTKILQWLLKPVLAEVLEKQRSVNAQINTLQSQVTSVDVRASRLQAELSDTELAISALLSDNTKASA